MISASARFSCSKIASNRCCLALLGYLLCVPAPAFAAHHIVAIPTPGDALTSQPKSPATLRVTLRKEYLYQSHKRLAIALIELRGKQCWTTAHRPLWLEKKKRYCRPYRKGALRHIRWYWAKARALDYDNTRACGLKRLQRRACVQMLQYRRVHWSGLDGKRIWWTSEIPMMAAGGTYRLSASFQRGQQRITMPGSHKECFTQPTAAKLTALVLRRDNSYVGYASELLHVPFVFYPGWTKGRHQTDQRWGADCVAVVLYGRRRMGFKLGYMAPPALLRITQNIGSVAQGTVARAKAKEALLNARIKRGDILHFGFQTAVLSRDVPPLGILNREDQVIHTYHRRATESQLAKLPYGHLAFQVRRW